MKPIINFLKLHVNLPIVTPWSLQVQSLGLLNVVMLLCRAGVRRSRPRWSGDFRCLAPCRAQNVSSVDSRTAPFGPALHVKCLEITLLWRDANKAENVFCGLVALLSTLYLCFKYIFYKKYIQNAHYTSWYPANDVVVGREIVCGGVWWCEMMLRFPGKGASKMLHGVNNKPIRNRSDEDFIR